MWSQGQAPFPHPSDLLSQEWGQHQCAPDPHGILLLLTVATTSPAGGSQAHPSCSHGTLGSEAVGFLTPVPRSSSRADLPAGQQQALRPGMRLRGERGQLQIHPWASRRQSLEETGRGGWPVFPAPGLGRAGPRGRAGPAPGRRLAGAPGCLLTLLSSQHPPELRAHRLWAQHRPVSAGDARPP